MVDRYVDFNKKYPPLQHNINSQNFNLFLNLNKLASLCPSCLSCRQNNKLDNDFCNRECLKEYLTKRLSENLCKHPIRNEINDIIAWKEDCDCDEYFSSIKSEIDSNYKSNHRASLEPVRALNYSSNSSYKVESPKLELIRALEVEEIKPEIIIQKTEEIIKVESINQLETDDTSYSNEEINEETFKPSEVEELELISQISWTDEELKQDIKQISTKELSIKEEVIEEIEVIQLGNGSSKNEPKEQGEDDEFKSKKARVRNLNNHLKPLLDDKKGMVEFFISTTIDEKINKVKRIKDLKNNDLVAKKIANKYIKKAGFIVCMSITEYHESSNPQHHMLGLKPPCSDACSLLDKSDRKRKFCWGCIDEQNEIFGLGKVNVRNVVDRIDTIDYATKRLKTSKDFSKKVIVPKSIKSSYLKENRKLDKLDKNDKKCLGWEKKEKIDNKDINITTPIVEVNKKKDFYHKNYLDNKPERNAKRAYQTRLLSLKKYEEDLNIPADKKQIKIDRLKKYIQEYELANGIK